VSKNAAGFPAIIDFGPERASAIGQRDSETESLAAWPGTSSPAIRIQIGSTLGMHKQFARCCGIDTIISRLPLGCMLRASGFGRLYPAPSLVS